VDHDDHVALLHPADLTRGGLWADLGAGSGAFTLALRELIGAEATIFAVDKDRARLAELEDAWRARFGDVRGLHLLNVDFSRALNLPPLDGIVMANSLHFFRDKRKILEHVGTLLKPDGELLLVEYDVDSGNPWVPYPLSFRTWQALASTVGFSEARLLATRPSSFLRGFYSAEVHSKGR